MTKAELEKENKELKETIATLIKETVAQHEWLEKRYRRDKSFDERCEGAFKDALLFDEGVVLITQKDALGPANTIQSLITAK